MHAVATKETNLLSPRLQGASRCECQVVDSAVPPTFQIRLIAFPVVLEGMERPSMGAILGFFALETLTA